MTNATHTPTPCLTCKWTLGTPIGKAGRNKQAIYSPRGHFADVSVYHDEDDELLRHLIRAVNEHDALTARVQELEKALDALSLAAYGAVNAPGVAKYAEAFESAQANARAALARVQS